MVDKCLIYIVQFFIICCSGTVSIFFFAIYLLVHVTFIRRVFFIDRIYANNKHYMCAVFNKFINAFLANFKFNMCKFALFMEVTSMTLIDLTL